MQRELNFSEENWTTFEYIWSAPRMEQYPPKMLTLEDTKMNIANTSQHHITSNTLQASFYTYHTACVYPIHSVNSQALQCNFHDFMKISQCIAMKIHQNWSRMYPLVISYSLLLKMARSKWWIYPFKMVDLSILNCKRLPEAKSH